MVFEGVNDVKSDSDDLIFFSHHKTRNNGIDVTTMIDSSVGAKVRGLFKPFSFHIDQYRDVTFYDKAFIPIDLMHPSEIKATDSEILDTTEKYLSESNEPVKITPLIEYVQAKIEGEAGIKKIRKTIIQNSILKNDYLPKGTRFVYTVGAKNAHLYELPKFQKQEDLFK
jgi:hypothetical protein